MKSLAAEMLAMTQLMERAEVLRAPDAVEEMARLAPGTCIPEGVKPLRPEDAPKVPACCLILRETGRKFPDNLVGFCADCQEPIQFRPSLAVSVKLCAFCCLARLNAENNML